MKPVARLQTPETHRSFASAQELDFAPHAGIVTYRTFVH